MRRLGVALSVPLILFLAQVPKSRVEGSTRGGQAPYRMSNSSPRQEGALTPSGVVDASTLQGRQSSAPNLSTLFLSRDPGALARAKALAREGRVGRRIGVVAPGGPGAARRSAPAYS